jgi:sulfonate transport system substrate-binding protein
VEIHVGYQRGGAEWNVLKAQGALEKRFGPNVKVTWTLFTAGPPLLEALNAGAIDIGATGETPPIFAQAAGTPLVYVAYQQGNGAGSGILVAENSPVKTLKDLAGKKIAFTKASSANLLLIKALQKEGLTYADIQPELLQPPDARAALEGGSVDAWVIWDPYYTAAQQEINARIVVDGSDVSPTRGYIEARSDFLQQHPDLVRGTVEELIAAQAWARANQDEYGALLEKETQIPASVWKASLNASDSDYHYLDDTTVKAQQEVADIFYNLKLIPEKLDIAKVVWRGDAD